MPRVKRILQDIARLLLAAILATVLVAWACAALIDVTSARRRSEGFMTGELFWSVGRWDRPGATYAISEIAKDWGWSPSQATGAPDTPSPGDRQTAWASSSSDGQREWLCLVFANAVVPKSVRVYESCSPGALDRVTVFTAAGNEVEAWRGKDPTSSGAPGGISEIPLPVNFPICKLKLHINSPAVSGWNEIDAVGLVSTAGDVQWARRAIASSSYSAPTSTVQGIGAMEALLPGWADARQFSPASWQENARSETRAIDGRGWPLVGMWCERDPTTGNAIAGALGVTRPASNKPDASVPGSAASAGSQPPYLISGSTISIPSSSPPTLRPALPLRIAWTGFVADVVFYMVILAGLRWLVTRPWRLVVEVSRLRKGCCITCGYDLGYDFRAGCPECGWRRPGTETRN